MPTAQHNDSEPHRSMKTLTPRRSGPRFGTPAVKVAALAAAGCTAYSADTSWRFAADYLDMVTTAERGVMFAAAELALFATALLARQNLHGPRQAPGLPGALVWLITGVQTIPAYAESGLVGGTVRAFVGPVMAAMLWHQAMGIELRQHKPQAASRSLLATLAREVRERLLSRLGIAARDRDAAQITRDRATTRAVTLAARLAERTPKQRTNRRGRRLARRLSKAIARSQAGINPQQREQLVRQLAARRHAAALATIELPSPWTESVRNPSHSDGRAPVLGIRDACAVPESRALVRDRERGLAPGGSAGAVEEDRPEIPAGHGQDTARSHPDESDGDRAQAVPHEAPSVPAPPHTTTGPAEGTPATGNGQRSEIPDTRRGPGRRPSAELDELLDIARAAIPADARVTYKRVKTAVRQAGHTVATDRAAGIRDRLIAERNTPAPRPTR